MRPIRGCSGGDGSLTPSDPKDTDALSALEECLQHRFGDRRLLEQALTHSSRANEEGDPAAGNERLEFLGDAVLDLVVSEWLMRAHPQADEGFLSRARADAVNTRALAERARQFGLDRHLRLGHGEQRSAGSEKASILANVFEAVLGAIYLDGGLQPVRTLIEREFASGLADTERSRRDPKTRLQEVLQAQGKQVPRYETVATFGPDHAREFQVEVRVAATVLGQGRGSSKRAAEQQAALAALEQIDT